MRRKWSERHKPKDMERRTENWLSEPCSPALGAAVNAALLVMFVALVLLLDWMGVVIVAGMCAVIRVCGKGV